MKRITDKIQLWTLDNFVSSDECSKLIELGYQKGFVASSVQSNINTKVDPSHDKGSMKTYARNSYTSFVGDSEIGNTFINKAKKILNDMKEPFGSIEGLQIQRYKPGQKYNPHYDSFEDKTGTDQRSWTVMVYLGSGKDTEPLEGGGTLFTKLDLRIIPKKGTAVIWNNLDSKHCRQQNTMHMGEAVTRGTKYIVTIWFRNPSGNEYICNKMESFKTHNTGTELSEISSEHSNYVLFIILILLLITIIYLIYLYIYKWKN